MNQLPPPQIPYYILVSHDDTRVQDDLHITSRWDAETNCGMKKSPSMPKLPTRASALSALSELTIPNKEWGDASGLKSANLPKSPVRVPARRDSILTSTDVLAGHRLRSLSAC